MKILIFYSGFLILVLIAFGIIKQKIFKINILLLFFIIIFSLGLYFKLGDFKAVKDQLKLEEISKNLPSPDKLITALKHHLQQHPDSSEGWYLLGKLELSQQDISAALEAFRKASQLNPHDPGILLNYAQVLWLEGHIDQAQKIVNQLIKLDPHNDAALNLLAMVSYQQKKYAKAIAIWEKLTEDYSPETPDGKMLLQAIAIAQQKESRV